MWETYSPLYLSYPPLWYLRSSSGEYGGICTTNKTYIRHLYKQEDRVATKWGIMYFPFPKFSRINQNRYIPWKLQYSWFGMLLKSQLYGPEGSNEICKSFQRYTVVIQTVLKSWCYCSSFQSPPATGGGPVVPVRPPAAILEPWAMNH